MPEMPNLAESENRNARDAQARHAAPHGTGIHGSGIHGTGIHDIGARCVWARSHGSGRASVYVRLFSPHRTSDGRRRG